MKTAIIILNYNDYDNTSNYVNNIKNYKSLNSIVVVDNFSTDGNYDRLKDLEKLNDNIYVIKTDKNGGYSYGNNFGIKYLETKFGKDFFDSYIISNPDVEVEDDTIKKCNERLFKEESLAVIAPRMWYVNGKARRSAWKERTPLIDIANSTRITEFLLFPFFKKGEYSKKSYNNSELYVDNVSGSFFLVKSKILQEIGYFDENVFLFYEEDILGKKISDKNYKILSLNDYKFMHYDSKTIGKLMSIFKKQKILFESRKYYHKKYNKVGNWYLALMTFLYYLRVIELCIEVPIRKVVGVFNEKK